MLLDVTSVQGSAVTNPATCVMKHMILNLPTIMTKVNARTKNTVRRPICKPVMHEALVDVGEGVCKVLFVS